MTPYPVTLAILALVAPAFGSVAAAQLPPSTVAAPAPAIAPSPAPSTGPAHLQLTLTGNPASPDFIAARIGDALNAELAPPGGSVRVMGILPAPRPLGSGFLTSFTVPLLIDPGGGGTPLAATASVDVDNAGVPPFAPSLLAFTDDPERITADGVLSRTDVAAGVPTRVYYYHENAQLPRRFCVVLAANGSVRTRVQVVGAAAGPNIDVMSVGHAVSKTFVTLQPHNEGVVVAIAGGKPVLERDTPVAPGEVVVGALDLRVLDGGPVSVTVMAIPPADQPTQYLYAPKLADDGHGRHGTFIIAGFAQRVVAYTAGGPDALDVYGTRARTPRAAGDATGHDYGDYGVLQHVTFDVDNPSAAAATVYLFERPLGGAVRSSFAVNGAVVDVGCVRVAQRYLVTPSIVPPHATQAIDVLSMTDGGSNYPLEVGLTTTPPRPTAPAIAAPDGCFPKPSRRAWPAQPAIRPAGH